ncbi:hypothetical protein BDV06DRAFT_227026 [Aspergillus oleicola]
MTKAYCAFCGVMLSQDLYGHPGPESLGRRRPWYAEIRGLVRKTIDDILSQTQVTSSAEIAYARRQRVTYRIATQTLCRSGSYLKTAQFTGASVFTTLPDRFFVYDFGF